MKIFIAVDSILGGAGNVAQIIAEYYSQNGVEVYLFLRVKRVESRYNLENVHIVGEKPFSSLRTYHKEILYLNKLIKSISPDIIISFLNSVSPQVLFSQWFTKIPIIVSERNNPFTNSPNQLYKIIRNIAYNRANLITVQFKLFKSFNKKALRKNKMVVMPNMILSSKIRKNYLEPVSKICFVTVSSLYYLKRIDLMIKVFASIHKKAPNTELNIYGEGVDLNNLKHLVSELGLEQAVNFCGYNSNVHDCLSKNDVYLMTSEREGFPNALSESLAVGLPSISFKCHDGLSELIHNGKNGYLVNEGDINGFIEAAMGLISDYNLRKQIGENAVDSIKKYNYNKIMVLWDKYVYSLLPNTIEP